MNLRRTNWILVATAAIVAASLVVSSSAYAAKQAITITQVDTSNYPQTRVAFTFPNKDEAVPSLTLKENGNSIRSVQVYNGSIGSYEADQGNVIMLALDTSQSMRGQKIDDAVDAAKALINQARKSDKIGLVTFGGDATVRIEPTNDFADVRAALNDVNIRSETTMFDSVKLAAEAFGKDTQSKTIVLISDGKDVGSEISLKEAAAAARDVKATVWTVAIQPPGVQPTELVELAESTNGQFKSVATSSQLERLFDDLGEAILRGRWLEYTTELSVGDVASISIAGDNFTTATKKFSVEAKGLKDGSTTKDASKVVESSEPLIPLPTGRLGLLLAALPFSLIIFFISLSALNKRSTPDVVARIERYTIPTKTTIERETRDESSLKTLISPLLAISESMLGGSRFFKKIKFMTEQADIAIRPNELFGVMIFSGMVSSLIGLMAAPILAVPVIGLIGLYIPYLWIKFKASRRKKAFDEQLPDILQGISSSLKAGHSFNQSIATLMKEMQAPAADEFKRVMTEARLGLPIETALQLMADRMGSDDFDFAVTTVNIQRTVGGSLADILEMVGDTVRNRQQFRKKVKALTSMGTMSAYVLIAMPGVIAAAISLMSPGYMAPLFNTPQGNMMLGIGVTSIIIGYFACMKIVKVKI